MKSLYSGSLLDPDSESCLAQFVLVCKDLVEVSRLDSQGLVEVYKAQ